LPTGTVVNLGIAGETSDKYDELALGSDQTIAALNNSGGGNASVLNAGGAGKVITLTITGVNTDGQAVNSNFGGLVMDGFGSESSGYDTTAIKVIGGTVTFTGNQNSYVGGTTIAGGIFYANNTSGSATGYGNVLVATGGTLRGSGIIAMTVQVNGSAVPAATGMTVADGGLIHPGTAAVGDVAQNYLTFSLSPALSRILEFQAETSGTAQLEFTLGGGGAPTDASGLTFAGSSSFIKLATDAAGEVKFDGNLVQIDDLTGGALDPNGDYLLFSGGANSDYAGLTTDANGLILSGLSLTGAGEGSLYLKNGDIILAAPEPPGWMLLAAGIGFAVLMRGCGVRGFLALG